MVWMCVKDDRQTTEEDIYEWIPTRTKENMKTETNVDTGYSSKYERTRMEDGA